MDQISMKTPNPKCRLFLKIDQYRCLAAGVYLSEALYTLPPSYTVTHYSENLDVGSHKLPLTFLAPFPSLAGTGLSPSTQLCA
jgi:hypothetical protein